MKKAALFLSFLAVTFAAQADGVTGSYTKKNGVIDIKQNGGDIAFSINSSVDMHACNMGEDDPLIAKVVDGNRAAWTSEDNTETCVVLLTFTPASVKVTTKDCDGYCGMNAVGSMDGVYKRKKGKK